ncbi:hypothetical protein [Thermomonas sp. HDW16]|uniref:hypothetical protein n=1 Tax=Thermomonas sp. HDW16 TaxID=2714945 RepID=UPI001409FC61|nr:hypothetical protein [Thermomonas sp. HDW16]QIL20305.1 hypothetical protein G7079_05870 [Thermomonas sp. HDW16]
MSAAPALDADALQTLRNLLTEIDPGCEVSIDDDSGELLVFGDLDATQVEDAIQQSGLGTHNAHAGSTCCGGCG